MAHNPYTPPRAELEGRLPGRAPGETFFAGDPYTSGQFALASFLGGPIAAGWLARSNFRSLGQPDKGGRILLWSALASVAIMLISAFLPEKFPHLVLPIAYTLTIRAMAERTFGIAVTKHQKEGGLNASWWGVVGVSLLSLLAFLAVAIAIMYGLDVLGVVKL